MYVLIRVAGLMTLRGNPLYYYREAVVDNANTPDVNEAVRQSTLRVTITDAQLSLVEPAITRYHYNQEAIGIAC